MTDPYELAQWPESRIEATADALIRYYIVCGLHAHRRFRSQVTNRVWETDPRLYGETIGHYCAYVSLVQALRGFRYAHPELADEEARSIWSLSESGNGFEWLYQWGEEEGLPMTEVSQAIDGLVYREGNNE